MRPIPVDDLVDLLKQLVELIPYDAVAGRIGREGVGEVEERQEQSVREGQQPRGRWRLLVLGHRSRRDLVECAEGAVLALRRWGWGYEVAELGGQREEVWKGRCGWPCGRGDGLV